MKHILLTSNSFGAAIAHYASSEPAFCGFLGLFCEDHRVRRVYVPASLLEKIKGIVERQRGRQWAENVVCRLIGVPCSSGDDDTEFEEMGTHVWLDKPDIPPHLLVFVHPDRNVLAEAKRRRAGSTFDFNVFEQAQLI